MNTLKIAASGETLRVMVLGTGALGLKLLDGIMEVPDLAKVVGYLPVSNIPRHSALQDHPNEKRLMQFALDRGVRVFDAPGVKSWEFKEELKTLKPHIVLVGGWPEILPASVVHVEKVAFINCHGSMLPKYRGACPFLASVFYGDERTGYTFHLIDEQIDTGDILLQREVVIGEKETALQLSDRIAEKFGQSVGALLGMIRSGDVVPKKQRGNISYVPSRDPKWGWIPWQSTPKIIDQRMRALYGYLPLVTSLNGTVIGFEQGDLVAAQTNGSSPRKSALHSVQNQLNPGQVVASELGKTIVATRDQNWHVELTRRIFVPTGDIASHNLEIVPGQQLVSMECVSILKST